MNCDGLVNVVDALFILQFEVGLRVDSGGCPLPPPPPNTHYVGACDVGEDGLCNVVDALFILQCEVGIPNIMCPAAAEAAVQAGSGRSFDGLRVSGVRALPLSPYR